MDNRSHGKDGPLPRYQNSFGFRHNPNSQKTKRIAAIAATTGCCRRCTAVIEWKRKYRKYKALAQPRKCVACAQPRLNLAYHTLCAACSNSRGVCPKCQVGKAEAVRIAAELESLTKQIALLQNTKGALPGISERERRSMLRECLREKAGLMEYSEEDAAAEGAAGAAGGGGKGGAEGTGGADADGDADGDGDSSGDNEEGDGSSDDDEGDEEGDEEGGEEGDKEGAADEEGGEEGAAKAPSCGAPAAASAEGGPALDGDGLVDPSFFTAALERAKRKARSLGELQG